MITTGDRSPHPYRVGPTEEEARGRDSERRKERKEEEERREIKTRINDDAFENIKRTNRYLEEKDKEVELDLDIIRQRALKLYLGAGYPEALGMTEIEYRNTFPELTELFTPEDRSLIKKKIEEEGFNDILIVDQRLPLSKQFELLIENAHDREEDPISSPFSFTFLAGSRDHDKPAEALDDLQELDPDKLTPDIIQYVGDDSRSRRQSAQYSRLVYILEHFDKTLSDITKPQKAAFRISLVQNYQEITSDTQTCIATELIQIFQREQNQATNLSEYLVLFRSHLGERGQFLDSKYWCWLPTDVCAQGALRVYWSSDPERPEDNGLNISTAKLGDYRAFMGGNRSTVLREIE
ncbi:MAG: hypothetical protein ABII72_02355 [Parcubacteria group bacterium]